MPQVSTPTSITTTVGTAATSIDVSFVNNNTSGNSTFNIRFVKIGDPTTVISASGISTGTAPAADTDPWTILVDFTANPPANVTMKQLASDYQAQVQAIAASGTAADNSSWGLQIYYHVGLTVTIQIGGVSVVLGESSIPKTYSLSSPVTVTYADLGIFVSSLPGNLTLPPTWPNGDTISSSLTVQTFTVNTETKLFDINVVFDLNWVIISGSGTSDTPILEAKQVGIEVIRTNGQAII